MSGACREPNDALYVLIVKYTLDIINDEDSDLGQKLREIFGNPRKLMKKHKEEESKYDDEMDEKEVQKKYDKDIVEQLSKFGYSNKTIYAAIDEIDGIQYDINMVVEQIETMHNQSYDKISITIKEKKDDSTTKNDIGILFSSNDSEHEDLEMNIGFSFSNIFEDGEPKFDDDQYTIPLAIFPKHQRWNVFLFIAWRKLTQLMHEDRAMDSVRSFTYYGRTFSTIAALPGPKVVIPDGHLRLYEGDYGIYYQIEEHHEQDVIATWRRSMVSRYYEVFEEKYKTIVNDSLLKTITGKWEIGEIIEEADDIIYDWEHGKDKDKYGKWKISITSFDLCWFDQIIEWIQGTDWDDSHIEDKNNKFIFKKLSWKPTEESHYRIDTNLHDFDPYTEREPAKAKYKSNPGPNYWLPSNVQVIDSELHLAIYNSNARAPTFDEEPVWCMAEAAVSSNPLIEYGQIKVDIKCYGQSLLLWSMDDEGKWSRNGTNFGRVLNDENTILEVVVNNHKTKEDEIVLFRSIPGDEFEFENVKGKEKSDLYKCQYGSLEMINLEMDWSENKMRFKAMKNKTWESTNMIPVPGEDKYLHFRIWCKKSEQGLGNADGNHPANDEPKHISISNLVINYV